MIRRNFLQLASALGLTAATGKVIQAQDRSSSNSISRMADAVEQFGRAQDHWLSQQSNKSEEPVAHRGPASVTVPFATMPMGFYCSNHGFHNRLPAPTAMQPILDQLRRRDTTLFCAVAKELARRQWRDWPAVPEINLQYTDGQPVKPCRTMSRRIFKDVAEMTTNDVAHIILCVTAGLRSEIRDRIKSARETANFPTGVPYYAQHEEVFVETEFDCFMFKTFAHVRWAGFINPPSAKLEKL
jgi:hypothetical protein